MNDTNNSEFLSFGQYLKNERLQQGIDLKRISNETKISVTNLSHIEMENYADLPAEIFMKSYLRSYATCLGMNSDEVIHRYLIGRSAYNAVTRNNEKFKPSRFRFHPGLLIFFSLLSAFILFYALVIHRTPSIPHSDQPEMPQEVKKEDKEADLDTKEVSSAPLPAAIDNQNRDVFSEKLILTIETIENTWIKIIIDEQNPREYSLKPKDRLTLEATRGYNLLIGNGAGVYLTLNEKPVNIPAKSGQVVNVQLP